MHRDFVSLHFKHGQCPCPDMMSTFGQQPLYRAFHWVHLPHYMTSIKKDCTTTWVQLFDLLMTRPPPVGKTIDITNDACAHRLLGALYPQLTKDPALLLDFLHESAEATYGIQLAKAAGCLVAEPQDETGGNITIDGIMSQSDLLFIK